MRDESKTRGRKQGSAATAAPRVPSKGPKEAPFPVVGLGASAGGLEALERFLQQVPPDSGMAFVVVQHLDPTHQGVLAELLQRSTPMKVRQVTDRMKVEPDRVYVIPPNKDMSILHGKLHLLEPAAPRGLRLPIDFFFRSLAADRRERAIGIILSGMGSDGNAGLRAIKEQGGVTLVQDPDSARFDGMPRSAIEAGLVDIVARAEELPGKIVAYLHHTPLLTQAGAIRDSKAQSSLEKVILLLRARSGHDFSRYKKSTLYRRVERRMGIHQIDKIAHYVRFLQGNPGEVDLLFKELLIGVTRFFRDPEVWEQLEAEALPALLASRPGGALRAWVPGCSTGEEAYSLAIAFQEVLEKLGLEGTRTLQIFATDLDRDAVDKARQGSFPANILADVPAARLSRFFVPEGDGYRVGTVIRETVIFAVQNVIMDPPFTKLDLLSCRNLLIYLEPELQANLLRIFHYSLNPGGMLLLGSAETVGSLTNLFVPLNRKVRVFRRSETDLAADAVAFPAAFVRALPGEGYAPRAPLPPMNLESLTDKLLLQRYAPPAVLVSTDGDILYVSGSTGKYLEPAAGKANWNVFAMAREGLRYEMTSAFQRTLRESGAATERAVVTGADGGEQGVEVTVQAIDEPAALRGTRLISFSDVSAPEKAPGKSRSRTHRPDRTGRAADASALQRLREDLQTTREEMQSSQEELQSANEELQSTNEELTTSREELQSLNEELQTVNAELQARVEELSLANSDMKNLLDSTDIATIFLDGELNVRRFTPRATSIVKLISSDVGRPFTDLSSTLLYPELTDDAREVLRTLVFSEKQVATRNHRWYLARIMPYRTPEDRIDGVVMTFSDITAAKSLEEELRRVQHELQADVAAGAEELARTSGLLESERRNPAKSARHRTEKKASGKEGKP